MIDFIGLFEVKKDETHAKSKVYFDLTLFKQPTKLLLLEKHWRTNFNQEHQRINNKGNR